MKFETLKPPTCARCTDVAAPSTFIRKRVPASVASMSEASTTWSAAKGTTPVRVVAQTAAPFFLAVSAMSPA